MNDMPSLPERDLPPGRHRQLKEHLMREIRNAPEPGGIRAGRKKWLLPAIGLPAAAGALALALLVAGVPEGTETGTETRPSRETAAQFLDRVALAAAHTDVPAEIRDDQYVYVSSVSRQHGEQPGERESWTAVDGRREGLARQDGEEFSLGKNSFSCYRCLEALPTDPEAMLEWLYDQQEEGDEDHDADQDAFVLIGDLLLDSLVPPDTAEALYRAAALIPGVSVVPNAQDATGRPGIAVSRTDSYNPDRSDELIFDEQSLELLGTRSVALTDMDLEDSEPVTAGEVLYSSAVLDRALVDEAGARP